jgi:hypothetical protein
MLVGNDNPSATSSTFNELLYGYFRVRRLLLLNCRLRKFSKCKKEAIPIPPTITIVDNSHLPFMGSHHYPRHIFWIAWLSNFITKTIPINNATSIDFDRIPAISISSGRFVGDNGGGKMIT